MRRNIISTPLVLAVLSIIFLFSPFNVSQKVKLSALYVFYPIKVVVNGFTQLMHGIIPPSPFDYGKSEELEKKVSQMENELRKLVSENAKLKLEVESLGMFREAVKEYSYDEVVAEVLVPSDASGWRKSMKIAGGAGDGLKEGMPVVWNNNIVGKIGSVGRFTSEVILLTDVGFKTPAVVVPQYVEEKVTKRDVGVVEGSGRDSARLKWIPQDNELKSDWLVITAGDFLGPVPIPKGLIAGKIARASFESAYYDIQVRPLINFRGLEFVVVLKGK